MSECPPDPPDELTDPGIDLGLDVGRYANVSYTHDAQTDDPIHGTADGLLAEGGRNARH